MQIQFTHVQILDAEVNLVSNVEVFLISLILKISYSEDVIFFVKNLAFL